MIDSTELKLGQVVIAGAGRDQGRPLVVVEVVDTHFVRVVDGDLRRIESPKLKKVKHLRKTHFVCDSLSQSLLASESISNADVRKALKVFTFKAE